MKLALNLASMLGNLSYRYPRYANSRKFGGA
jgi:hypothetical protein